MENASATRLRFKGSATSSSKKRKHSSDKYHSHLDSHTTPSRRSWSRSRSPRRSSKEDKEGDRRRDRKHKSRAHSRSRSSSPSSSSYRSQSQRNRSSKYKVTPAGYAPDSLDSYCFDYDDVDLEAAYIRKLLQEQRERDMEQQLAEETEDPWLSHLFDESVNDDPYEYHSSRFSTQTPVAPRSRKRQQQDNIQSMSDDAYTSYMRKGMGRSQTQKEAQEWLEWVEEQERSKYKDARREQKQKDEERSRRRQERREKERLDQETEASARAGIGSHQREDDTPANQLRKRALVHQARKVYEQGWRALLSVEDSGQGATTTALPPLSMENVPWPPLYGTSESLDDVSDTTSKVSLFDFLFFGTTADQTDVRKQLLRREQLKFHPDKFKQRFGARLPPASTESFDMSTLSAVTVGMIPGERERILEQVDKVARALNELGEIF
ncbi:hypothetical protein BG015_008350 [Linnemannia schmuckeri]|uniref:J domain-containing protein n=1 Tax=Linnemannia schmuckeri TaxID=64567 RepID=A0A9P5VAL0_9FUNG|nr:hypothetical protein BG015_008350 [Linnemannia schmuckeri]